MKDLQKIKEFFSKPMNEGNKEYFKPLIRKNKSNPNFLYVDILYPVDTGFTTALGSKTMLGQDKEEGAAKALAMGNAVAKKLKAKYDLEDIDVSDLENGKVEVFAVSDDFIKIDSPSLDEAKISHIVGGIPYKRTRKPKEDKIEIIQKLDEPTKIKLIKKFKEKNWEVKPNEKGGLTATKKLMSIPEEMNVNEAEGKYKIAYNGKGFYGIAKGDKIEGEYSKEEAQKKADKLNKTMISTNPFISDFKVGDIISFKDGEDWKVMKVKDNVGKLVIKPYNEKAKKGNVSLEIDVDLDYLKKNLNEAKSNPEVDKLLKVMNDKKAGPEYKKALMDLIAMAEKKSGKTIQTKKEALLALDYVEPLISETNGFKSGKEFINIKLQKYPKAIAKVNQLINMVGESNFTMEIAEWIFDFFNNASYESPMNEAKEEDAVDTITMDIPLFLRMLEYSREDASQDMDLHDVTEKSNLLGKERGILSMEDYEEIVGAAEDTPEKELTEANVPSNIKDFAKRKGVSSLVNKVAGWAEKVGARIAGGTAVGMNYATLVLDLDYKQQGEIRINTDNETIKLYDEPVDNFNAFQRVYVDYKDLDENVAPNHNGKSSPYGSGYKPLEEKIAKALDKINEELCPAGKAYIKRRQAAGEKSSAYLSGRGVKVCKGQMSGKAKKK
jgi:hypothetical protein